MNPTTGKPRLILTAFRTQGPMTDEQLCWWMAHFKLKPATVRRIRWKLVEEGLLRFAKKFRRTASGHWGQVWEMS